MFYKGLIKVLVGVAALMGLFATNVFAQNNANVTVNANVPKVCRFVTNTGSFTIDHGAGTIDQTSGSNATGGTTLTYRCSNTIVPQFNIDGGTFGSTASATVTLVAGANNMSATVDVAGGGAGTGLGGGQDKTATVSGLIVPANFQNVNPANYSASVTVGIQATP